MSKGFPDSSVGKESACNAGDPGWIPGLGRSAGEGIDYPLQYSWASLVARLVKNPPAMRETWVQSPGWDDPLPWRREWLSTPVFWPGEFHGLYSPWGRKESEATEQLSLTHFYSARDVLHCKWILYCLSHQGSPRILQWVGYPFSRGTSQPRI